MIRPAWTLTGCLALAFLFGCGEAAYDPAADDAGSPEVAAVETDIIETDIVDAEAPEADEPVEVTLSEDEIEEIKNLPEEDAALALEQKICPISDEHLGSMGVPIKVTADGKSAFICCAGCEKLFNRNPEAALAKLGLDKDEPGEEGEATP